MKFLLEEEPEIVEAVKESEDRALIKLPINPHNAPVYSELEKELTAIDVIDGRTIKEASEIHGPSKSAIGKYVNGESVAPDTRARILDHKYQIQDIAVTKLMDTLGLINPEQVDKQRDLIAIATGLSQVVEKVSDKGSAVNQVHLHLYAPNQKKESDYDVIEA